MRTLALCTLWIALTGPAVAQASLEAARALAAEGRLAEARRAVEELVDVADSPDQRAAALDLLGTIEALADDYVAAARAWRRAAELGDAAEISLEARARLRLAERLLAQTGAQAAERPQLPAVIPPQAPPESAATGATEVAGAAAPSEPAEPSPLAVPERPGEPAPLTPRLTVPVEQVAGAVLVAGDGQPTEVIEETLQIFISHLRERGVDAEMIPSAVWWRRSYESVSPLLLDTVRRAGAASLVYIDLRFGHRERLVMRCVGPDGREAWREKVTGGTAFSADHRPHEKINPDLVERLLKKLDKRIDAPCLPLAPE